MKKDSRTWCLWCVEYNNYTGAGGVLIFQDKNLGLSRVLYETKQQAENVLLEIMQD